MLRFSTRRHAGAGLHWRAFFIAVTTLCAMLSMPVCAADIEVKIDNFAFTPKRAHSEGRDDHRLPQSRRHSAQRRRSQGRVSFQGARYGRQFFVHLRKNWDLPLFLWPSSPNARQDRGHAVSAGDIHFRVILGTAILSFHFNGRLAESDNDYSQARTSWFF